MIHLINKSKNYMIISIDMDKSFDEIQHRFMIRKSLIKMDIEVIYVHKIKVIYDKPIIKIILNGEKHESLSLNLGTRLAYPLSLFLLNMVLEVRATAIIQEKEKIVIEVGRDVVKKKSLFADDMILYIENPKDSTHTHTQNC